MKHEDKTKEQLAIELAELRQRIKELEAKETERRKAEEALREAIKEVKQLKDKLRVENLYLREEISLMHSHKDIVGNSEAIRTVLKQIEQVAPTDSTVLIQGRRAPGRNCSLMRYMT